MSVTKKDNTESKILKAARQVFMRKGLAGARMQEIADTAGINKALLHYYFRNKQKLFETIFSKAIQQLVPQLEASMLSATPIEQKIRSFVHHYIGMLEENPYLPVFVLSAINHNPELPIHILRKNGLPLTQILRIFESEMEKGNIRKMDPRELFLNIIALCIFPFAASPLLTNVLYSEDSEGYNQFQKERKDRVTAFILNSICMPQESTTVKCD